MALRDFCIWTLHIYIYIYIAIGYFELKGINIQGGRNINIFLHEILAVSERVYAKLYYLLNKLHFLTVAC